MALLRALAIVLGLLLLLSEPVRADTVWLDPDLIDAIKERLRDTDGIKSHDYVFAAQEDEPFLRGRVLGVGSVYRVDLTTRYDRGQERAYYNDKIVMAIWKRTAEGGVEWAKNVVNLDPTFVAGIDFENDHAIDLDLAFVSRYDSSGRPEVIARRILAQHIDGPTWAASLRQALDPQDELSLADKEGAAVPNLTKEEDLEWKGWLIYALTNKRPRSQDDYKEFQELWERDGSLSLGGSPESLLESILLELARLETIDGYADQLPLPEKELERLQRGGFRVPKLNPDPAANDNNLMMWKRAHLRCAQFLCRLAKVTVGGSGDERERRVWYRDAGQRARLRTILLLERARPGHLTPQDVFDDTLRQAISAKLDKLAQTDLDPYLVEFWKDHYAPLLVESQPAGQDYSRTLSPQARLEINPTVMALQALELIQQEPSFWVEQNQTPQEPGDGLRLVQALLDLTTELKISLRDDTGRGFQVEIPDVRDVADGASEEEARALRAQLRLKAKQTLIHILRPPADRVANWNARNPGFLPKVERFRNNSRSLLLRLAASGRSWQQSAAQDAISGSYQDRAEAAGAALLAAGMGTPKQTWPIIQSLLAVATTHDAATGDRRGGPGGRRGGRRRDGRSGRDGRGRSENASRRQPTGRPAAGGDQPANRVEARAVRQRQNLADQRRESAIRTLLMLAELKDRPGSTADEKLIGELALGEIGKVMVRQKTGKATRGEQLFLAMLGERSDGQRVNSLLGGQDGYVARQVNQLERRVSLLQERLDMAAEQGLNDDQVDNLRERLKTATEKLEQLKSAGSRRGPSGDHQPRQPRRPGRDR